VAGNHMGIIQIDLGTRAFATITKHAAGFVAGCDECGSEETAVGG
jgi:hypothetical protein